MLSRPVKRPEFQIAFFKHTEICVAQSQNVCVVFFWFQHFSTIFFFMRIFNLTNSTVQSMEFLCNIEMLHLI